MRRRFFPATPVQTVPGRTVELEVQLRPEPVAKAATASTPGAGGAAAVTWLTPSLLGHPDLYSIDHGDGVYELRSRPDGPAGPADMDGLEYSIWRGTPVSIVDDYVQALPGPDFHCTELELTTSVLPWDEATVIWSVYGVIEGANLSDAHWVCQWDLPSEDDPAVSERGNSVTTYGNLVLVTPHYTNGRQDYLETLTAIAYSGGAEVGRLIFRARGYGW